MRPVTRPTPLPEPWRLLAAAVLAALVALAPGPAASAQDEETAAEEEAAESERLPEEGLPDIDAILRSDEEIWSGGGYSYDPGDRRDPFKSLLDPRELEDKGPRPEGVPGLLIDEITLSGVFRTPRGWIAQVQATNQEKAYLIKEGDQLYDGDVVSIGKDEVVFKQVVQDPTALKPFREVVKTLSP